MKRTYHPLVEYFYLTGMLGDQHLATIPYTTKKYWSASKPESLFGFEWVKTFSDDYQATRHIAKHRIIFQSARVCCKIVDSFSTILSKKRGLKSLMRENKILVIDTIDRLTSKIKLARACKIFRITTKMYYRWKNEVHCSASVLNLCFKSHPSQLTLTEASKIKDAVTDSGNNHKPGSTIYYSLLRGNKLYCGLSTFYKYVRLFGPGVVKTAIEPDRKKFRAKRPFEYLHIDTTFLYTETGGKRRVAFVKDNFSKAILHVAILENASSGLIRNLVATAFEKFGLLYRTDPIFIVSDDGSENKGELIKWVNGITDARVEKLIAGKDFPFTNAMSESVHHLYKTFFAPGKVYLDDNHLQQDLDRFVKFVNYEWYPTEHFGMAPIELLNYGAVDRTRFTDQIKKAKKKRVIENRQFPLCNAVRKFPMVFALDYSSTKKINQRAKCDEISDIKS